MTRRRTPRRLLAASFLAVLTVLVGGVANAYWSAPGNGAGAATSGTTQAVTLTPATATATLYPGGGASVLLSVSNPNLSPVRIGSLALDTSQGNNAGFAVDAGHTGCVLATLSFSKQTNGGAGWIVPAKTNGTNGTLSVTLANALTMGVDGADACQGATFTIYLAAGQ